MLLKTIILKIYKPLRLNEEGQSLVLVTLFLFFVFLAFAALAVDGTIVYLHRRKLQNIADAATLAAAVDLSQQKTEAEAYQTAMDTIAANRGEIEWYSTNSTPNPPATNVGTGLNLTMGIEITNGCNVRVALNWSDVGTYFAQFVGRDFLQVSARAHAGCNRAGGLQPIAMKRFGDYDDLLYDPPSSSPKPNKPSTIYCDDCNIRQSLAASSPDNQGNGTAYDFFRIEGSDVITEWPGWPDGTGIYQPPSPHAILSTPGRPFFFLGSNTSPNSGGSFSGHVNLDIRRPSGAVSVKYYNGVTAGTNTNTLKDYGEYYIRRGYCCDIPDPGDLVALLNGVSNDFGPKALFETYAVGDIISIIIYDGTVVETPTMNMTGEIPNQKSTYPMTNTVTSDVLTYTITLEAVDTFQTSPHGLSMSVEGLDGFAEWGFSNASPTVGHSGIDTRDVILTITPTLKTTTVGTVTTTSVVTGTRMFYVKAIDDKFSGSGVIRYWAGVASIGDTIIDGVTSLPITRTIPAVSGIPTNLEENYPFLIVAKGKQANYDIELNLWEGATDQDVTVQFDGSLPTGVSWVGGNPFPFTETNVRASPPPESVVPIKLDIDSTATADTTYELPFTVTAADGMTQTFKIYLFVEEVDSSTTQFVEILGYAAVEILGYYNGNNPGNENSTNAVYGRFVSELKNDPSSLIYGLGPRLIPWKVQ